MNEDFLHRIRVQPPPEFLARLKAKLDRQPLQPRARLVRTVFAGLLAGASALALASLVVRGEFAGLHWNGWSGAHPSSASSEAGTRSAADASGQRGQALPDGWVHNPWAAATPPPSGKPLKKEATGKPAVVAIPQSALMASNASVAVYNGALAPAHVGSVRIVFARPAEPFMDRLVNSLVGAGLNRPEVSVEPVDRVLANLCASSSFDFAIVSRRMTATEAAECARRWTPGPMVEAKLGYEAVMLVRSKALGPLSISARDLYLALAKTVPNPANPAQMVPNPYVTWSEVDSALPPDRIQVMGPSLHSEVGQAFVSLIVEAGCNTVAPLAAQQSADDHDVRCRTLREDGAYVESAEPRSPFVQTLEAQPTVVAVFPYSSLQGTEAGLAAAAIDGVQATDESIANGSYPASRTWYMYVTRGLSSPSARSFLQVCLVLRVCLGRVDDAGLSSGTFIPPSRSERAEVRANTLKALDPQSLGE